MIPSLGKEHAKRIQEPVKFFSELGNLHDARIRLVEWNPVQQEIAFLIDALYSNFDGLPEYPGLQPVRLAVGGVRWLGADVIRDEALLLIMDFAVEEASPDSTIHVTVKFVPSGHTRIAGKLISCRPQ